MGNDFFDLTKFGFRRRFTVFSLIFAFLAGNASAQLANERFEFDEKRISTVLPLGWKSSDRGNPATTIAGFEHSDKTAGVFYTRFMSADDMTMQDLMKQAIQGYKNGFEVKEEGEVRTGQVQGPGDKKWPAIYTTLELELVMKSTSLTKPDKHVPYRFYLMVFDTGSRLVLIQGSAQKPIILGREKDILKIMKDTVVQM